MSKKKVIFSIILIVLIIILIYLFLIFYKPASIKMQTYTSLYPEEKGEEYILSEGDVIRNLEIVNIKPDKVVVKWEDKIEECEYNDTYQFYHTSTEIFFCFPAITVSFTRNIDI